MWRAVAQVLLSAETAIVNLACGSPDQLCVPADSPREHLKIRAAGRLARIASHDAAEFWRELEEVK